MKNFTKQNIKTCPLWIRLFIMTFMLLIGTSSAWAGKAYSNDYVYLYVGNFTNWKNDNAQFKVTLNTWDNTGGGSKYYVCMTAVPNMTNYYYAKITNGISALNNSVYGMWFYRCGSCSGSGTGGNSGWNDFFVSDTSGNSGEMKDGKNLARVSGWSSGALDTNFALTPSSVTLKVTSGATGGTGTQNDPYLVEVGTQFTLSASNLTFNPADPEMVGRYNFGTSTTSAPTGTSTTSTQTASSTANTTKQYYVSVRGYYNGVYSSSYKTASVYVKTVASCDDVAAPTLSIERGITNNCDDITTGIIAITNYAQFSNCTFTLNDNAVIPTDAGKIIDVTASGPCTVVVTNDCGNSSEPVSIDMPKTTVKAPTVYDVSLTYPQVSFATNTGGVNINLSLSERDVTYYLYKNGDKVTGSDKQGNGKALTWSVLESGTYTVKADNPCTSGVIDMKGSVDFTCMSNLELAFEGDKSVFCPGETANIIVTFNGTGKGDENTNPGKYGWQWTTDNITYTSVYLTESGVKVPVTIKGDGSISLSVRSCNGTVSKELTFTTHKIVAPDIKFTPNPVKEGTVTVLSIENYDPNNTYEFNGPDDLQGSMAQTTEFQLPEGSYDFTVTATSKVCSSLTATSEVATLVVKEGGVAIDILGDAAIYSNDPTDFVAMYVTEKNGMADFPDAEGIAISSYTWEFSDNGTSNWTACKEYDNATLGVKNSGSKCNNLRPNKVGYYRCVISYIDGAKNHVGSLTSNVLQVTQAGTNPNTSGGKNQHIASVGGKWTLPLVVVNTGGEGFPTCSSGSYPSAQTDKLKKKRSVDVKIFNPDGTVYYDRKARMNYRGSSSLNFKKKSYAFCPGKENCGDDEKGADYVKTSKENLFGLSNGAKDKDWVLYAAAADPSLMRNRVVFNTFKEMTGEWGVDTKYVELVVDGVYQGVYVLMDKITVNEKRVNITDKNGFIVKFDKTDKEDREKSLLESGMEVGDEKTFMTTRTGRLGIVTYGTKVDQLFEIEYPEKEDVEDEGGSWAVTLDFIKQKFEQFETALANSDYATVRNLIDYQSWADWFIINEYTKNVDAYRASCVFVYNGDKIEARPLWDQELSFNNQAGASIEKKGCNNTSGLLIQHDGAYTDCFPAPFWFIGKTVNFGSCGGNDGSSTITGTIGGYLINDECFVNTIKQRWTIHMNNSLSSTALKAKVDAYAAELKTAITREGKRWSDDFRCTAECGGITGYNSQSYNNSVKTLTEWITGDRTTNLNAAIANLKGASAAGITITMEPSTGVTTPWIPVKVLVNAPASATIKYDDTSITEGITEKNDKAIKTVNDKLYTYIFPRPAAWGTGNVATPIKDKTYEISATITNASGDCPSVSNTATATIKLADEGNDNCVK